ncbi:MAG: bifunctional SulP family inorganic anion transporter/carbonic anhydrase [Parachlamydiaceae bacterium]
MSNSNLFSAKTLPYDLIAGLVVFLVALPLCLGIALASNAPLFSGILAGIIGGIVVGILSGSQTSVSGPAAGLTAVVAAQIEQLGSFEAFLTAVVLAGLIQIILSIVRMGFIAAFFPSSVIKGLLSAIGVILILKQIPHLFGHDVDPIGNKSFLQADNQNTFSELIEAWFDIHPGPALVGLLSVLLLVMWDKINFLRKTLIPSPLVVVIVGVVAKFILQQSTYWAIEPSHLVQVPEAESIKGFFNFLIFPDFSVLSNPSVYPSAITIALVASLNALLNLEATDKIDPLHRHSPPNRELMAQGVGNVIVGLIGGIPTASVIVRSSVNLNAGVRSKISTIWHGTLLLGCVMFIPSLLNQIPLSALAAILFTTGLKLASPKLFMQMWREGQNQFLPFVVTIIAIVFSDLLVGVLIGLGISICFILHSHIRSPLKKILEKHSTGDEVLRIELPNQVGFFNRASIEETLQGIPPNSHVLIDAHNSDYVDPDVLDLIADYQSTANMQNISLSLVGFKDKYPKLDDNIQYMDFSSYETQASLTPEKVLEILQEGNARFRQGLRLKRDLSRQLDAATTGQFPMAVVLSCIDSRTPVELIFDLSLGDVFSVRIAGNVVSPKVLGSIEYSCAVAGAKLILVMGHTSCGAVRASVELICQQQTALEATGCVNLDSLVSEIQKCVDVTSCQHLLEVDAKQKGDYFDEVAYQNVLRTMRRMREDSQTLDRLISEGKVALIGAMYNISTAEVSFFQPVDLAPPKIPESR